MSRPPSKKEMILSAASHSFARHGYDRTTLEEIAQECAITKPAIYYHFRDKHTLYEAVLCRYFEVLQEKILQETDLSTPTKALESYILLFGGFILEHPEFGSMLSRELSQGAEELPAKCHEKLATILQRLNAILEKGKEEGVFDAPNPFLIQVMVVSTLINYQSTQKLRKKIGTMMGAELSSVAPMEEILPALSQKILKGLTC